MRRVRTECLVRNHLSVKVPPSPPVHLLTMHKLRGDGNKMQMMAKVKDFINDWLNYTQVYILHFYDCSPTTSPVIEDSALFHPFAYFDEVSKLCCLPFRISKCSLHPFYARPVINSMDNFLFPIFLSFESL